VKELWEGFASDQYIRYSCSSGGVATALSLFCIEAFGMHGVLHTRARADAPHLNQTVLSLSREQVLLGIGSRYSPASPCEGLAKIENAPGACAFIGKPCDVAGTYQARKLRQALDRKIGITISIFCYGTPSTQGTKAMLYRMGIKDQSSLLSLRYRGMGWPGNARASFINGCKKEMRELTYEEAWGEILQKYRPWRCYMCIDHSGEYSDISIGDSWHRRRDADSAGWSLVVVRTEVGRHLLNEAVKAGYLTIEKAKYDTLSHSQPSFLDSRGKVWARIVVSRLMKEPAPKYRHMPMFRFWLLNVSFSQKVGSIAGTALKIIKKKIYMRRLQTNTTGL
jgi:coenzyme F420 hydrogenase subunit beta